MNDLAEEQAPGKMWLSLSDIPEDGLYIDFKEHPHKLHLGVGEIKLCDTVEFTGWISKVDEDILVRGSLKAVAELTCGRCLKQFLCPITGQVNVKYYPEGISGGEEIELKEEDIDVYFYYKNRIDVGKALRDQILLAIPMKPLCASNCKGLCHRCGTNLNEGPCKCMDGNTDPRLMILKAINKVREE